MILADVRDDTDRGTDDFGKLSRLPFGIYANFDDSGLVACRQP
jgi:hypothetical protein